MVCRLGWQISRGGANTWGPSGVGTALTLSVPWSTATRQCATSSQAKTTVSARLARCGPPKLLLHTLLLTPCHTEGLGTIEVDVVIVQGLAKLYVVNILL